MNTNLLSILVCPLCKGKLEYDHERQELICHFDRLAYPIRDGVPVMLASDARVVPLANQEKQQGDDQS
ncbi:MAG: Trm112 family protein [Legionellales bacterium]|nr:Trm112 family protein [Legionellales bacterium]